jgi:hypothetical protein
MLPMSSQSPVSGYSLLYELIVPKDKGSTMIYTGFQFRSLRKPSVSPKRIIRLSK